jgi:hypothetical protein
MDAWVDNPDPYVQLDERIFERERQKWAGAPHGHDLGRRSTRSTDRFADVE